MMTGFIPSRADVDRYLRLRNLSYRISNELVRQIPKAAFDGVAEALGMLHDDCLFLESEDMSAVLADCCIYDWYEDGQNVVERYAAAHPAPAGSDERLLLNAFLQAQYRVLDVGSVVPGAGVDCTDILTNEDLFVMDVGLSRNTHWDHMLASRTIPLGDFWMTGGAGLPMVPRAGFVDTVRSFGKSRPEGFEGPGGLTMMIVRACLAAGAAEHTAYAKPKPREPRHFTRRNRHRRQ